MVIEIHVADRKPRPGENNLVNHGWTAIDFFTLQRMLLKGSWKVPVYKPPTKRDIDMSEIG
jgi:hypothetical protein